MTLTETAEIEKEQLYELEHNTEEGKHIDTPLTIENETDALEKAGFTEITKGDGGKDNYCLFIAKKGDIKMEFRKIFDTIPEQFDKFRPRYSQELFDNLIAYAKIGPGKKVLEIGPGTGQATEPILNTGCDYNAIELGEHLYAKMKEKFGDRPNFNIVNDDFITHDFEGQKFDLIYSAATIQWIPEDIAFSKTFELLAPGGTLAMLLTKSEYKSTNPALHDDIQKIYDAYFKPETPYQQRGFHYQNATNYGYVDFEERDFYGKREMTADEYVAFSGTHCDHMVIAEPFKTKFFDGLHNAVLAHGNKIIFNDTYVMYLTKKPI